jgi:regulatory protein
MQKLPPVADLAHLEHTARTYVERFWGPSSNLRRVLLRHVTKSVHAHGSDPEQSRELVEQVIARFVEAGAVDDRKFAEGTARIRRERGGSRRAIEMVLRQKGLPEADIAHALHEAAEEGHTDLTAAHALARRRRLGPYRPPEERAERRQKDLMALARAGFDFGTAMKVIGGSRADEDFEG